MKKILIVEDEINIQNELKSLLNNAGYQVSILIDYKNALEEIIKTPVDLILMDINIPYMNGELLLKEVRNHINTPVIMVTSRNSEVDEVLSMSYGADDYITKPYNPTILLLRIQNILRRAVTSPNYLVYKDLKVYSSKGVIMKNDKEYSLTKNEMIIFIYLINNIGQIVTRDTLMTELWNNSEYINDNALTVNISRLRTKLEDMGYKEAIETRKGQGYKLI